MIWNNRFCIFTFVYIVFGSQNHLREKEQSNLFNYHTKSECVALKEVQSLNLVLPTSTNASIQANILIFSVTAATDWTRSHPSFTRR